MGIWAAFWLIGLVWGSSFMLIRIGVESIHPIMLVLIRVGIAAVGLSLVVVVQRKPIPRDWRTIGAIALIGIGNTAIPFTLISWGEQTVESGIASVLQATAALFGLVVAHFAFRDERINPQKITGLLLGFVGVIVLSSRNWQDGVLVTGGLAGQFAIVLASLFYAVFTSYSRKVLQGNIAPVVIAAISMLSATFAEAFFLLIGVVAFDVPPTLPADLETQALLAVLGLGVFNTFLAYLLFYNVVRVLGAAKATMITYIVPPIGLLLGVIFLNERVDLPLILGASLIFMGIAIVNLRRFDWLNSRYARIRGAGSSA